MSDTMPPVALPEDYEPDLLTLEDEDGQEHVFEVIDATDINNERYLAVAPYFSNPADTLAEEASLLFMRLVQEGGEEEYLDIVENEDELACVLEVFTNRLSEIYDIDTEDFLPEGKN